jgi:4-hydroxybenzoate polyprenyltransferase
VQDVEIDRRERLHSLPAKMGVPAAFSVARACHVLSVVALALAGWAAGVGMLYAVGVAAVAGLLLYEHSLVSPANTTRLDQAFFSMNGIVSIVFFGFVLLERVL